MTSSTRSEKAVPPRPMTLGRQPGRGIRGCPYKWGVGHEFTAGVNAEFAVDTAEIGLDGLHRDERGGRHLLIGQAARNQPGYPLLGRGQLTDTAPLQAQAP